MVQELHWKVFSPVWVFMWIDKTCLSENVSVQKIHLNGFSSMSVFIWSDKTLLQENDLLQKLHLKGFFQLESFCEQLEYALEKMSCYINYI